MKAICTALVTAAMLGVSQPAAAAVSCQGTITGKSVIYDGSVLIRGSWRGDYTQICNIKAEWNGVTPDVCATWVAMADAALSMGKSLYLWYPDNDACGTLPVWSASPRPYQVIMF